MAELCCLVCELAELCSGDCKCSGECPTTCDDCKCCGECPATFDCKCCDECPAACDDCKCCHAPRCGDCCLRCSNCWLKSCPTQNSKDWCVSRQCPECCSDSCSCNCPHVTGNYISCNIDCYCNENCNSQSWGDFRETGSHMGRMTDCSSGCGPEVACCEGCFTWAFCCVCATASLLAHSKNPANGSVRHGELVLRRPHCGHALTALCLPPCALCIVRHQLRQRHGVLTQPCHLCLDSFAVIVCLPCTLAQVSRASRPYEWMPCHDVPPPALVVDRVLVEQVQMDFSSTSAVWGVPVNVAGGQPSPAFQTDRSPFPGLVQME
jgi:hypothetical protein